MSIDGSHFAGRLYPNVTFASPVSHFPSSLDSSISKGPAALCKASCTVPVTAASGAAARPGQVALTTASISNLVISPSHSDTFSLMVEFGRYSLGSCFSLSEHSRFFVVKLNAH